MVLSLLAGATAALLAIRADSARSTIAIESPTIRTAPVVGVNDVLVADSLVVAKRAHTLTLYHMGRAVKRYRVALGRVPVGDKVRQGDNRTPEGLYYIDWRNPGSRYYKALHISYPDDRHIERARQLGVSPGGDVMIHGLPPRFAAYGAAQAEHDWTEGCIALSDQQMDEIWRAVPVGTPILITP
jgi:murein L,D-transpeptidase YafK